MKKLLNNILLALALLGVCAVHAEDSEWNVEQETATRQALVDWVTENAHDRLTETKSTEIVDAVTAQAKELDLDVNLVLAIIRTESGFREKAAGFGSKGLMQVQVYWHRDKLRGRNPFDAKVSIEVGTKILRDCMDKSGRNVMKALRCYNGGGDKHYYAKVEKVRRTIDQHARQSVFERLMARLSNPQAD